MGATRLGADLHPSGHPDGSGRHTKASLALWLTHKGIEFLSDINRRGDVADQGVAMNPSDSMARLGLAAFVQVRFVPISHIMSTEVDPVVLSLRPR